MEGNCVATFSASPMPVDGRTNNSLLSEGPALSNATRVPSGDQNGFLSSNGLDVVSGKPPPVDRSMIQIVKGHVHETQDLLWGHRGGDDFAGMAMATPGLKGRLAEREGFEPSVQFPVHTLSKR